MQAAKLLRPLLDSELNPVIFCRYLATADFLAAIVLNETSASARICA